MNNVHSKLKQRNIQSELKSSFEIMVILLCYSTYIIYMEYLLKVNLILSLLFLRCVDHKIIIMPLLPTVILFIDTDITARNNVDKYCNTEIIFSLEDLLFFIQHCSLFTLHNSCIQIEIPSKKEFFFSEHHKGPTILCCNFRR